MENVHSGLKPDRVDSAPCVAVKRRDNFEDAATTKSPQRFCRWAGFSALRCVTGLSNFRPDRAGVFRSRRHEPTYRRGLIRSRFFILPIYVYLYESAAAGRPKQDLDWRDANNAA